MKTLLAIGLTWPEPESTAAGQRMLQLLEAFQEAGYCIHFCSPAQKTNYALDLATLGIQEHPVALNDATFDGFVMDLKPDLVLFDRFLAEEQFGWRVAERVPLALRILDTEDLHSLRHGREQAVKKGKPFTTEDWLHQDKTLRELASIYRSDLSLIISDYEMELLTEEVKMERSLLLHLPFMVPAMGQVPTWTGFGERKDFVFIGGGRHTPNLDAIQQLKTTLWPLIHKELPTAKLYIYGAHLPQNILGMHQPSDGFVVKGWAKNEKSVMEKARVCLAPLRYGAGIKGKLLSAMRFGTPSITSSIGAEGMHHNLPWNGIIADKPEDFAAAAVSLYTDQKKWETSQQAGITLVNTLYRKEPLKNRLFNRIMELEHSLQPHRTKNILGRMFQHQTLQASKYLGKWIEAKNGKD